MGQDIVAFESLPESLRQQIFERLQSIPANAEVKIQTVRHESISHYSPPDLPISIPKDWINIWTDFFHVQSLEQLTKWEQVLFSLNCACVKFYHTWKADNPPADPVPFEWKYRLKSAVNEKLGKPDLSLDQARWLYRFTGQRGPVHHMITREDLAEDTRHLARLIYSRHPDVAGIAGVARSGMAPAVDISLMLGVDLYEATPDGCRLLSGGVRRVGTLHGERRIDNGPIVIVDDSTCSGYSRKQYQQLGHPFYTVYAGGDGKRIVDGFAVPIELPHHFEWNLFHNGVLLDKCGTCFDMDGVFCEDCPADCDDDGPRYLDWMRRVKPLQWNIEYQVQTIITARREVYRNQTLDWLGRHGIRVKELVMFPGTFEERSRTNVAAWKAEQAIARNRGIFVESDYRQACEIARLMPGCQVVSIERPKHVLES
ncbi:hypothetical protein SH449x_000758 [Pirellulaceae bacterium SH449]